MAQDLIPIEDENPIWRDQQDNLAAQAKARGESDPGPLPVELHPVIIGLGKKWGVGAVWPPVGALATPGAAPFWCQRWDVLWEKITKDKMDLRSQALRIRRAAEIMRDRQGQTKADYRQAIELQALESASRPPAREGAAELPLWACTTECGLLLIHGDSGQVQQAIRSREMVLLRELPHGGAAALRLECGFEIPAPQAAYWSHAGKACHVLFALVEDAVVAATLVGSPEPGNSQ
jgi:hypothetical protein